MWGGTYAVQYTGFTENALVSGSSRRKKDGTHKEMSLLSELNGKCLIIKDYSELSTMKDEGRNKIDAILRDAYDGFVSRRFGHVGQKSFKTKFSIIGATTSAHEAIDTTVSKSFGQRFVFFRPVGISSSDRKRFFDHCLSVGGATHAWRRHLNGLVSAWSDQASVPDNVECDREGLFDLCDLTAVARTPIIRDKYRGRAVVLPPEHEHGVRIGKAIHLAMRIVSYLGGAPHRVAKRIARNSIVPSIRGDALETIYHAGLCGRDQICEQCRVSGKVAGEAIEDLILLGLVRPTSMKVTNSRYGRGGRPARQYSIHDEWCSKCDLIFGDKWDDEEQVDWRNADLSRLEDLEKKAKKASEDNRASLETIEEHELLYGGEE